MKRARAVVANTPGLVEALVSDWRKAAKFYSRFGVTEEMFRHGVSAETVVIALCDLGTTQGS